MNHTFACDCHTHSGYSPCGSHAPQAMAGRAQELGLYAYALTDHCECNAYEEEYRERAQKAWQAMEELRLTGSMRFYRGVELGQPMQNLSGAKEAVERYDYDFVIGSLHNLRGEPDFYYMDYTAATPADIDRLLERYWDELLEMIDWGGFDTLGHLTYPLRYIQGDHGIAVDLAPHAGKIDEVFRGLIAKDIALELNTAGLRQTIGETAPGPELVKRYRELGGRLVTLGSDAHVTEDVGEGIDQGMELLKAAGFTEFAVYEKRRPVMLPLE